MFVGGQEGFVGDVGLNRKSVKVDWTSQGDALLRKRQQQSIG